MARGQNKLVTIIGSAYFQPIADLIDRWLATQRRPSPNKVQSGYYEHGYAASVALLLVAMLESYISRLRFVQHAKIPSTVSKPLEIVTCMYPKLRHMKALTEIYVLRDTLMHNHLWEIDYEWGGSPAMVLKGATKHPAYGDRKYKARVNEKTRRTRALNLNVVPSRVDRRDVLKVFDTVWKTLLRFEATGRFQCYVSHEHVRFRGKIVLFSELRQELVNAL